MFIIVLSSSPSVHERDVVVAKSPYGSDSIWDGLAAEEKFSRQPSTARDQKSHQAFSVSEMAVMRLKGHPSKLFCIRVIAKIHGYQRFIKRIRQFEKENTIGNHFKMRTAWTVRRVIIRKPI